MFGAKTTQSLFGATTTTTQSGFGGFGTQPSGGGLFGNAASSSVIYIDLFYLIQACLVAQTYKEQFCFLNNKI